MPEKDYRDYLEYTRKAMEHTRAQSEKLLKKVVFRRFLLVVGLMILQALVLFWIVHTLDRLAPFILAAMTAAAVIIVIHIFNQNINPAFKLSWTLLITVFPVGGGFLYLFVQNNPGTHTLRRETARTIAETRGLLTPSSMLMQTIKAFSPKAWNLANYLTTYGGGQAYGCCHVRYYPLGEDMFRDLLAELEKAKDFIFLEYFIMAEGLMWNSVLALLQRKIAEGVEVRVMYDGMGCLFTLCPKYWEQLREMGIRAKIFSPVKPLLSTIQNFRDHRKILIIDGKIAFSGGVNMADEYINAKVVHGHWKDTAIKVSGEAVDSYTLMFLQLWNVEASHPEDYEQYLHKTDAFPEASGILIPYADSPVDGERVGETVYLDIIARATSYVHIMTPYLIITNEMFTALTTAAKSGVDVKIILPGVADKWYAFAVGRTFYKDLVAAGVKIYEYTPGFVHAKGFVSDGESAVVSTINLDYRSLYHHFECGTYLYRTDAIDDMETDFQNTLEKCQPITPEVIQGYPLAQKLLGRLLRLIAPLL